MSENNGVMNGRGGFNEVIGSTVAQWNAAKDSRFKRERELPSGGASADYHFSTESDFYKITEYARAMERDDVIIAPALRKATHLTIGDGFMFKPDSGNEKYDLAWWELFDEYSNSPDMCDISRENTFGQITGLSFHSMIRDGDIVALAVETGEGKNKNIALQMIESHQIRSPMDQHGRAAKDVILGVKLDGSRVRKNYYVTGENPAAADIFTEEKLRRVDTFAKVGNAEYRQLFHLYHPDRASQTRGVSALAPAFDTAGMIEDINFAKLVQSLVVSCIGFIRQTAAGSEMPGDKKPSNPLDKFRMIPDDIGNMLEEIQPGFMFKTSPGEKIESFSPKVPNAEFFDQVKLALTMVGVNIGLPLIIMLMDASETNFSGWRGAFDQAKEGFMSNQKVVDLRLLTPFMRLWTAVQIASGRLKPPKSLASGKEFRHEWGGRRWPFIQPVQDAMTAILRQRNLLASPRLVHSEMGQDFETVTDHTIADNAYAISGAAKRAAELNKMLDKDGDVYQPKVNWRDLISLPTYDRVNASYAVTDNTDQPNQDVPTTPSPTKKAAKPPAAIPGD